jgi:hypothetical protein
LQENSAAEIGFPPLRWNNEHARHIKDAGEKLMNPDPNELTAKLTSAPSETEAAIIIAALADEGIRAETDEYTSGLRAGAWNWVDIIVAEQDLPRAQEILVKVQEENSHIDWKNVDVGDPADEEH